MPISIFISKWLTSMVKQITVSTNEIYHLSGSLSQRGRFKPLYERSSDLSQSTRLKVFYQLKVSKNEMVKQMALSTNGSQQLAFFKEVVLNHSTKGAMTGSFRRASCSISMPSISKKSAKLKRLSQLLQLLIKFISKTFSKKLF